MPNYRKTAWYIDSDAVRKMMIEELGIRGVSHVQVGEETGVYAANLGRFLNVTNTSMTGDSLVTLIKWAGGDVNRFLRRRRSVARHTDTFEQRKLRTAAAYLKSQGVALEEGESSTDALMRLVELAKNNGFLGGTE